MKFIPTAVIRTVARHRLMAQKNAPSVLFASGIAGVVGSTILACRATLKLEEVLAETRHNFERIEEASRLEEYTDEDRKKDTVIVYARAATRIALLYAPSFILGAASITALTSAHGILIRRNAALTAAYAALEKGFNEYRERVIDKYGRDKDREFRYGVEKVEITDEETRKTRTVKRVAQGTPSIYARFFDQFSKSWNKDAEINRLFLQCQQNYANDLLQARGHVFLNEVYDMLGIERSQAGQVVGWVLSRGGGDNYIDFGIFDDNERVRDFVNGRESSILLDFNVDGVIFDRIEEWSDQYPWQS